MENYYHFFNILMNTIFVCILLLSIITLIIYLKNKKSDKIITDNLPFYIINLKRSKERWNKMETQLIDLKINYKKFIALDGNNHIFSEREKLYLKNFDANKNFGNKRNIKGLYGCALSHYYIWKMMIDNDISECIICEDDIVFNKNFITEINLLSNKFNSYDIIYFYNTIKYKKYGENKLIKFDKKEWKGFGNVIYYINNKTAKYLVSQIEKTGIYRAIDWYVYDQYKNINIGYSKYPLVSLRKVNSDIHIFNE